MSLKLDEKRLEHPEPGTLNPAENTKFMNICFASGESYVQHLCAALKSIFLNKNPEEEFNITILSKDISEKNKKYISSIAGIGSKVNFIDVDEEKLKDSCVITSDVRHIDSLATYYRFLLTDFVKEDKVLYLDCDLIVKKPLWDLYNTNIEDCYAAGVTDSLEKENCERLGLKKYINAGVLFVNLALWRKDNIKDKLINWSILNKDKIVWADQDVINTVLQDKIKYLDKTCNAQVSECGFGTTGEFNKIADDAVIVHYVGERKPWQNNRFNLSSYYYRYLLKTKFAYKFYLLLLSEIFSIKNEITGGRKYITVRILGLQIKIRKEKK